MSVAEIGSGEIASEIGREAVSKEGGHVAARPRRRHSNMSKLRSFLSRSAMDLHDDWNLLAIGALNVLHVGGGVG